MIDEQPNCFCLPEFEGNPPLTQCQPPQSPCNPSPCGPNTQCTRLNNGIAKCTCLPGYIESPNTIRGCVQPRNPCEPNPCGFGATCDVSRSPVCYCPDGTAGNPFRQCNQIPVVPELCRPGPCGTNADCYVANSREQCFCRSGFIGDPYAGCREPPRSVCEPSPCGPGAQCIVTNDGQSLCRCPNGMSGDPTSLSGCQGFECHIDDDCPNSKACLGFRCRDPCPGSCGLNAYCKVEKHHPVCYCDQGFAGDPLIRCFVEDEPQHSPCMPSPCGPNTECSILGDRAVCSCQPDHLGDPQAGCRPECVINSDCPTDKACMNKRCETPCQPYTCGVNSECRVVDHTANCFCSSGFMGDAFIRCTPIPVISNTTARPCQPSPCGGSQCNVYGNGVAVCDRCASTGNYNNPACRPECLLNADCAFDRACIGQRCADPCIGICGQNAICQVINHNPICSCPPGLYGNPFAHCSTPLTPHRDETGTCSSIQCGPNTECREHNGILACVCRPEYFGNPLLGCRPECVINPDCSLNQACSNMKCINPCADACGFGAECQVVNHFPVCSCPQGYTGDALISCTPAQIFVPVNPCDPSPCGANSRCLLSENGYAVCSCLPGYRGSPPVCQPECVSHSECPSSKACVNLKCIDPCPGVCGANARCEVINHSPICSCRPGETGNPFVSCSFPPTIENERRPENPCSPSPCGPNSICQITQGHPVCSCIENYIGAPPFCRPECILSNDCPQDKACIQERCENPCANACGPNAECHVIAHSAYCHCISGFRGDAFVGCSRIPEIAYVPDEPCNPSPCGENSQCTVQNGIAKCSCIPPYIGDPYTAGCRPECVYNSDCSSGLACIHQHCRNPCPGVCGTNAECVVVNHIPVCTCESGYTGDPFSGCRVQIIDRTSLF